MVRERTKDCDVRPGLTLGLGFRIAGAMSSGFLGRLDYDADQEVP